MEDGYSRALYILDAEHFEDSFNYELFKKLYIMRRANIIGDY